MRTASRRTSTRPRFERALTAAAGRPVQVGFTAHLVPMRRGILVTGYLRARSGVTQAAIDEAHAAFAAHRPFIRTVTRPPETQRTLYTNLAEVSATLDRRTGTIIAFTAIDNLVKGAAGQAIQNLNLMLGLPGETGLLPR